jgi:hypothetical protein
VRQIWGDFSTLFQKHTFPAKRALVVLALLAASTDGAIMVGVE